MQKFQAVWDQSATLSHSKYVSSLFKRYILELLLNCALEQCILHLRMHNGQKSNYTLIFTTIPIIFAESCMFEDNVI